jgi:hypothetical protein
LLLLFLWLKFDECCSTTDDDVEELGEVDVDEDEDEDDDGTKSGDMEAALSGLNDDVLLLLFC